MKLVGNCQGMPVVHAGKGREGEIVWLPHGPARVAHGPLAAVRQQHQGRASPSHQVVANVPGHHGVHQDEVEALAEQSLDNFVAQSSRVTLDNVLQYP